MAHSVDINIAGIDFLLSTSGAAVRRSDDPAYQGFQGRAPSGVRLAELRVRLHSDGLPSLEGLATVFRASDSWTLLSDGVDYWISFDPPTFDAPLWVARFDRQVSEVAVHCGEAFVEKRPGGDVVCSPLRYPLDQILLVYALAARRGLAVHAAGAVLDGRGYAFLGRSGAGKSSLSRRLVSRGFGTMLSDDRLVFREIDGRFRVFGTPWPGDAGVARNADASLDGLLFLHHGEENLIRPLDSQQALHQLLAVSSLLWYDRTVLPDMLDFCADLTARTPAYELHFRPDDEVVDVIAQFATGR